MKNKSRYKNLFLIIIISLGIWIYYKYNQEYYYIVKYMTTYRSIDIMVSIVISFVFLEYFISSYYYYILNRNNIIIRLKKRKYKIYIAKKVVLSVILFFLVNIFVDFILFQNVNIYFLIFNTIIISITVLTLSKRKEYDYELLILLFLNIIIRLLLFNYY